jgi:transposase
MTENEKKQVVELWQGGMPLTQIRQMIAVSAREFRTTIEEMRKNGDLGGGRKNTEKKVLEAFDGGERNIKAIAEIYRVSESTVYHYLHKNGRYLGTKARNWVHSERTLDIVEDLKEGKLSLYKIAKKHKVSCQYLTKIKRKWQKGIFDYGEQRKAD